MRTEDDIRAALTTLEREAPDAHDVLAPLAGDPGRRPNRPRVLVAVAAATALAIAAVPALRAITSGEQPDPSEPAGGPRWEYTFRVDPPRGWAVGHRAVGGSPSQSVTLSGPGDARCDVTVFRAGAFDTSRISGERSLVFINGHRGYIAEVKGLTGVVSFDADGRPVNKDIPTTAVVWEYAPDSWGLSNCDAMAPKRPRAAVIADEKATAQAVHVTPQALRMPYRIGYLPAGWEARDITVEGRTLAGPPQPDMWLSLGRESTGDQTTAADKVRNANGSSKNPPHNDPHVSILFTKGHSVTPPADSTRTTIHGQPAWLWHDPKPGTRFGKPADTASGIHIRWEGYELRIEGITAGPGFEAEIKKIAEGLELAANPADESTWFDGTVAIP
jgi:hypothetical protein